MSAVCVSYVETDIIRLSQRRQELLRELRHIDAALQERTETLARFRSELKSFVATDSGDPVESDEKDVWSEASGDANTGIQKIQDSKVRAGKGTDLEEIIVSDIEVAQKNVSAHLREQVDALLFSVDRTDANEIVAYLFDDTPDIVSAHRAAVVDGNISVTRISAYEWLVAYGAKIVPQHEREDSDTVELPEPNANPDDPKGELVGAVEVPCAPDVVIDVWKLERKDGSQAVWATTTIDGIAFCQLERISLRSETHWGLSSVAEITLFGRHPSTDSTITEVIDMS